MARQLDARSRWARCRATRAMAGLTAALAIGLLLPAGAMAQVATTTSLSPSPNPSVWGQQVTFTAKVTAEGVPVPAGTVTLMEQGTVLSGPVAVDAAGEARFTSNSLTPGEHPIVAFYDPGTTEFKASASQEVTQAVDKAASMLTASLTPRPLVPGQWVSVTVTAKPVAPGAGIPQGNVVFKVANGPVLGSVPLDSSARATATYPPPAGTWTVYPDYEGDAYFKPASALIIVDVDKATTTTTITTSPNPVAPGGSLTVSAMVSENAPANLEPFGGFYGALRLAVDGEAFGPPVPLAGGYYGFAVTLTAPDVPMQNTFSAHYSGDQNTEPSSASLVQVVGLPTTPGAPKPSAKDQLKALNNALAAALRRGGFAALGKASQTFTAPAAGKLDLRVYSPKAPKSARASAAKPVLLASVNRSFAAAGKAKVRLKVTRAGRRAMRRARSMKIAIVSRFTPSGGTAVVVTKSTTLKRSGTARTTAIPAWKTLDVRTLR